MMNATFIGSSALGLLGLLLWAGNANAVPCQNNLPPSNPDSVYIDHDDGTVTDTRTGLMWKQCAEGLSGVTCQNGIPRVLNWAEALADAEVSIFANYNDWRLPNVKELSSLVEDCRVGPSINTNLFPNTPSGGFWSSSPRVDVADVWLVFFNYGAAGHGPRYVNYFARVRLVRGGQAGDVALPSDDLTRLPEVDPAVGYLAFLEGNPGVEGDGVFVTSSRVTFTDYSLTVEPKSLVGALEEGVTLTVISRLPRATAYANIFYEFGYLGTPCLVRVHDNDNVRPNKLNYEAAYFSRSVLESITDSVKVGLGSGGLRITNPTGCSEAQLSGMFFNRFEFQHFGLDPVELDAAILDAGHVTR